nr:NAD(P)/FAD-dependent oxidoreductase [uncultured Butyrivibrio sp.]
MAFTRLFEEGKIGKLPLKNRVVMPAMGVGLAEPDGHANEHIIRYYEERARGGVGLIITEVTRVEPMYGTACPCQLGAYKLSHITGIQRLTDRVHRHGAKIFMQLHHPGRENHAIQIEGRQIVAPSEVMCKVCQEMPRALSTEEVEDLVKAFVHGAVIAKAGGMDGVELHGAHGYLLNEFMSPYTNKREDKYGGSFEKRLTIMKEIIAGIRTQCGSDFPISVRISADEFVEGGLKIEDTVEIAKCLESFGIDVINVSTGIYESSTTIVEPASFAQGWKKHFGLAIKAAVSIPVIAVNNIKEPSVAEELLEEGVCDFVGIARANLADPEWTKKAQCGREAEINRCIGCLNCFGAIGANGHIKCTVNPRCGREVEFDKINRNGDGRTVAVIGGGPAGMEAALTLKDRGFKPVIFEKENVLGGQLNLADKPVLKDKLGAYKKGLIARIENSGIEVKLGTEATVDNVKAISPVGVFLTSGGTPIVPPIPGIDGKNVITAEEFLSGAKDVGDGSVVVIGGGNTGMEVAETLCYKGREVTLVEMLNQIGRGLYPSVLVDYITRVTQQGEKICTGQKVLSIDEKGITIQSTKDNTESRVDADNVIVALGVKSQNALLAPLKELGVPVLAAGDANVPGRIMEATLDAVNLAYGFME